MAKPQLRRAGWKCQSGDCGASIVVVGADELLEMKSNRELELARDSGSMSNSWAATSPPSASAYVNAVSD